jgi:hypothetical protein
MGRWGLWLAIKTRFRQAPKCQYGEAVFLAQPIESSGPIGLNRLGRAAYERGPIPLGWNPHHRGTCSMAATAPTSVNFLCRTGAGEYPPSLAWANWRERTMAFMSLFLLATGLCVQAQQHVQAVVARHIVECFDLRNIRMLSFNSWQG